MKDLRTMEKYAGLPICTITQRVPFHDVDVMQVAWHGHYVKYFELARCGVLQCIDYDYPQMRESGFAWPVVDLSVRFAKPANYGDELEITAVITEWDIRLLIVYQVFNKSTNSMSTTGKTVQVPVSERTGELQFGCPEILGQCIQAWKKSNENPSRH